MDSPPEHCNLILASASPRRRELLALLRVPFRVCTADVDETPLPGEKAEQVAARLARAKALAVAERVAGVILAADTVVALDDEILGKPANPQEAFAMLRRLRGRAHQVFTGIAVLDTRTGQIVTEVVSTEVWMDNYSDEQIARYVASGDPMDKAGAYAIQNKDFAPVVHLLGCPANVMGLPVCKVVQVLRTFGWPLDGTAVSTCRPTDNFCAIRDRVVPGLARDPSDPEPDP